MSTSRRAFHARAQPAGSGDTTTCRAVRGSICSPLASPCLALLPTSFFFCVSSRAHAASHLFPMPSALPEAPVLRIRGGYSPSCARFIASRDSRPLGALGPARCPNTGANRRGVSQLPLPSSLLPPQLPLCTRRFLAFLLRCTRYLYLAVPPPSVSCSPHCACPFFLVVFFWFSLLRGRSGYVFPFKHSLR